MDFLVNIRRNSACRIAILLALAAGCGPTRYDPEASAHKREKMEARIASVLTEQARAAAGRDAVAAVVLAATNTNFGAEHQRILSALRERLGSAERPLREWVLPAQMINAGEGNDPPPADLTPAWLEARLKESPGVGVIISLADAPAVADAKQLPAGLPPLVCLAPLSDAKVRPLLAAGAVKAAIVPRVGQPAKDGKNWFDIRFEVVTAAGGT